MLTRFYYRLLLAILPSVETHLQGFARQVDRLDAFTTRIERAIEEEAVKLATDAHSRRVAVTALNEAYDRREGKSMDFINGVRKELHKASEARDAVADFLARLG